MCGHRVLGRGIVFSHTNLVVIGSARQALGQYTAINQYPLINPAHAPSDVFNASLMQTASAA